MAIDPELRVLCRRQPAGAGAGRAVRHADPDHDRRAAVGYRHRRHGPAGAVQRAGDVRPRGRGGGRRRYAAARQDRHDHARQPPGDASSCRSPGVSERELADAAQLASLADETPEGRSIVVLAKEKYGIRGRDMAPLHAHFRPVHGADAASAASISTASSIRKGAVDAVLAYVEAGMPRPTAARRLPSSRRVGLRRARADGHRRADRQGRRHAAGRRQGWPAARRHPPEGHRQGRHPRALRRAAPDGHPHGDDHRRQPADRGGHRRRSRRRRFPRPGDARGQAQADPRRAGQGQAGRDVRRRHQRRAGAGAGRCRRRDEHRHAWRRARPATWSISTAIRPS